MSVILKSERQIDGLRKAGHLVAQIYEQLRRHIAPGVTTLELDRIAEEFIRAHGAEPIYKGYTPPGHGLARPRVPFPASICVAVNEVICHGIPRGDIPLVDGDIVGIDIGVLLDGWVGDACVTFLIGRVDARGRQLVDTARECLERGVAACGPGTHLGDVGSAIQRLAESRGFSVVRDYVGHGVGRMLHEEPSVSHFGNRGTGLVLKPGMVFTIEPMINEGVPETITLADGWTVCTLDGKRSAQFEHTVAITETGYEVLTVL